MKEQNLRWCRWRWRWRAGSCLWCAALVLFALYLLLYHGGSAAALSHASALRAPLPFLNRPSPLLSLRIPGVVLSCKAARTSPRGGEREERSEEKKEEKRREQNKTEGRKKRAEEKSREQNRENKRTEARGIG